MHDHVMRGLRAWPAALPWLVGSALTAFTAIWLWVALTRILYPFDLDFLEDDILVEAWRMAQGLPVFLPPNADFVPHAYAPLYMLLSALVFKLSGPSFLPMRLLSFVATLCSGGLLLWAAYRVSRRVAVALLAPGLFLAGYALTGAQYELARVDALFIALILAGTLAGISRGDSAGGRIVAALCLALAFFTKQTALVFGLGMAVYLLGTQRHRALDYVIVYLAVVVVPLIALDRLTAGWSSFYLIVVPQNDPLALARIVDYARHDLLQELGPLCAILAALIVVRLRGVPAQSRLSRDWPLFALLAVLTSGWMRARLGGNLNSLLPAYAFLSLIPVLLDADLPRTEDPLPDPCRDIDATSTAIALSSPTGTLHTGPLPVARVLLCLAILWQLALGIYNPLSEVPRSDMRESGQRLIERIRQTPGPVLVLEHPFYALLAGKEPGVALTALWHARLRGAAPLPADLVERIRNHYYALVITDDGEYPEVTAASDALLNTSYQLEQPQCASDGPPTLNGVNVQPRFNYYPTR